MSFKKNKTADVIADEKLILLVGKCVIDYIMICEEFPKEDSDKRSLDGYWQRGGNASNNATVLRNFNAPVEFLGVLSKSSAFSCLVEDCQKRGIIIDHCPQVDGDPAFSSIILSKATGTRTIVHCANNFPELSFKHFEAIKDLNNYQWVHFEARHINETIKILTKIREYNAKQTNTDNRIIISVDLENLTEKVFKLAALADYSILGKDLAQFMGWNDPITACKGLRSYLSKLNEQYYTKSVIIVPWSDQGASFMDENDIVDLVPAYPVSCIVDSLGAGDTFCASFIFCKAIKKMSLKESIQFANKVAGFKLGHRGYDAVKEMRF